MKSDLIHADKKVLENAQAICSVLDKPVFQPLGKDVKLSGTPLILVHPFYLGIYSADYTVFSNNFSLCNLLNKDYVSNIMKLIKTFQGNIYLYESGLSFPFTEDVFIDKRGSLDGIYFFETEKDSSKPANILNGDGSAELIKISEEFLFAGGRVGRRRASDEKFKGCLGSLYQKMREGNFYGDFVPGCCFE